MKDYDDLTEEYILETVQLGQLDSDKIEGIKNDLISIVENQF